MKKLEHYFKSIDLKVSTLLIILLSLLSGRFRPLFIHLLVAFIHEMGHFFAALCFKVKVNKITVLPFGFYLQIDELEHIHVIKELLIVLAGPLMYFVNQAILLLLFNNGIISHQLLYQGIDANNIILIFNLLPIYPLDGSRIASIIISFFLRYKSMKKLSYILSLLSFFILLYIGYNSSNIIVYGYLILMQIYFVIHFKEFYLAFIISRLRKNQYKKTIVNLKNDYYRPYHNVFLVKGKFMSENQFAMNLLNRSLAKKRN